MAAAVGHDEERVAAREVHSRKKGRGRGRGQGFLPRGRRTTVAARACGDYDQGMGFDNYHEPPEELPQATRTFARMIASLTEECEAINWYEQRIAVEKDADAKAIMKNAQHEEFKHFGMDLEFLLRRHPQWRETLKGILFTTGDIVKKGDAAEEASE
jgi:hypothetical protein